MLNTISMYMGGEIRLWFHNNTCKWEHKKSLVRNKMNFKMLVKVSSQSRWLWFRSHTDQAKLTTHKVSWWNELIIALYCSSKWVFNRHAKARNCAYYFAHNTEKSMENNCDNDQHKYNCYKSNVIINEIFAAQFYSSQIDRSTVTS